RIIGTDSSVIYTSLKPAFSSLNILTTLPSLTTPLVQTARLTSINLSTSPSLATTVLTLTNPLDTAYTLTRLTSTVLFNGQVIGRIDQEVDVVVEGGGRVEMGGVEMGLVVSREAIRAVVLGVGGGLRVDVSARLETRVGGYPAEIEYRQEGVETFVG
ncbi:hypothetical protein HDU67_002228, partial [Dinochytrium kinnereticum]